MIVGWRGGAPSTFDYFPSEGLRSESLGGGIATATFGYHPDGAIETLTWNRQGSATRVRKHSAISYDLGGLRTGEDVTITLPGDALATGDTGGKAAMTYDLAGRLTSWTSPFRLDDGSSTWVWLLRDTDGNVATELKDDGTILAQRAYDPYGSPDEGGISGTAGSSLGFQGATTDEATGRVLLGPRQYDPETQRFTSADFYIGATSDMALGTDPLTGNRYLFAAANPVAFYEDGHGVCADTEGNDCRYEPYTGGSGSRKPVPCRHLGCGRGDFSRMSRQTRMDWLEDFSTRHAEDFGAGEWSNAIYDGLRFARDANLVRQSEYFSQVDANILYSIQLGARLARGEGASPYQSTVAAQYWRHFFLARQGGTDDSTSKRLWAQAEGEATSAGSRLAIEAGALPSPQMQVFAGATVYWRAVVGGELGFEIGDPEAPIYDPRSVGPVYEMAHMIYRD